MQVSKALELDNGIKGIEVTGVVKRVFEIKPMTGPNGPWKTQNVVFMDSIDNSITVMVSLRKGFLADTDKGAVITLPDCERGSYPKTNKSDGSIETVNKLDCKGIPKRGGGGGTAVATPPSPGMAQKPTPPPVPGTIKPNVDWDKKDLLIARESAFKSAATIIAAQIQVGAIAQGIDIMEYAARMSDFFVQVIYGGYVKKEPEVAKVTETTEEEMEKRYSIIKMLQTSQSRYNVSLEEIMTIANERFSKECGAITELQQLNHDKLEMLLKEIVDTKALHKKVKEPVKTVDDVNKELADETLL